MHLLTAAKESKLRLAQSFLILCLAGLLIFYHLYTLSDLYLGPGPRVIGAYDHIQSVLRLMIVISLLLVILGVGPALWGMWLSIGGLVATHYWAHFGNLPVDFTAGRHPASYLKGFIIPTIITAAFLYRRPAASCQQR